MPTSSQRVPKRASLGDNLLRTVTTACVLLSLIAALLGSAMPAVAAQDCAHTSTGLVPLNDLGADTYLGYTGGLYPDGSNEIPQAHLELGLRQAGMIVARDANGDPDPNGLIGFVSIGVSNTKTEFDGFVDFVEQADGVNPQLVVLNGAQGSRALGAWAESPDANPWQNLDDDLQRAGLTAAQVQAAWIKLPANTRGTISLEDVEPELAELREVLHIMNDRFPNLRVAYMASRVYAAYSPGENAEPKAYQHGFTIKWLIEEQIDGSVDLNADEAVGPVRSPWIAWGPYLWADGTNPRSDGLFYECTDLDDDGIHPGVGVTQKVTELLFGHLSTHPTAAPWFLGSGQTETAPATTQSAVPSSTPPTAPPSTTAPTSSVTTLASTAPETAPPLDQPSASRSPAPLVGTAVAAVLLGGIAGAVIERRRSKRP